VVAMLAYDVLAALLTEFDEVLFATELCVEFTEELTAELWGVSVLAELLLEPPQADN